VHSVPGAIPDRTEFLFKKGQANPADPVFHIVKSLSSLGASHIGIPCNTFHSPKILGRFQELLEQQEIEINFVNIVEETAEVFSQHYAHIRKAAVLGTLGTFRAETYLGPLHARGIEVVELVPQIQEKVHNSIYDRKFGLKSNSSVHPYTRECLVEVVKSVKAQGAEAVILGCTELGLAIKQDQMDQLVIVDSVRALARGLLREAAPHILKPWHRNKDISS